MKKNIITVLFFAVLCIVGCKSKNGATDSSAAGHTHSESCTHSHEGHSHDAHSHEAHNHSEHEHNHSAHSHDAHGHDEGLHAGEIKFSKAQAEAVGLETEIVTPAPFRCSPRCHNIRSTLLLKSLNIRGNVYCKGRKNRFGQRTTPSGRRPCRES